MFFKKNAKIQNNNEVSTKMKRDDIVPSSKDSYINVIKEKIPCSSDFFLRELTNGITLSYLETMIDKNSLHQDVICAIQDEYAKTPNELLSKIQVGNIQTTRNLDEAVLRIFSGSVLIHMDGFSQVIEVNIVSSKSRSLSQPENESQVIGAQLAFNESLSTNISLVRRYVTDPELYNETIYIGRRTNTAISLLYIKGLASDEMVATVRQRISSIQIDGIIDSSYLAQLIEDSSLSIFPQMILTERPDRTSSWLLNGKIVVMVDGSTLAIVAPQSFIEFFQSMEDQNVRWHIATFLRVLRIAAMFLSVFFSAIYVASLTFHYEVIPQPLLGPLSESRSRVPFPPIIEALFLEFMIELLREAGARLPTKVGQTMGIVGGIVIGTAAVQAGFTSNILIIIIALGALASFTTPSYMMGNVIRILRFPLIMLGGFWGYYGIMFGFCFMLIHLLRQSSLGVPFLTPFYPPRLLDWRDSIIRLPIPFNNNRPKSQRPMEVQKFSPEEVNHDNESD
jgi:hypothetical protein